MPEVHLSGHLVCSDARQAALVEQHLPEHVALTRAEPGCLYFTVEPTDHPLIWRVHERFASTAAFDDHQRRTARSAWARATAGIERRYTIDAVNP